MSQVLATHSRLAWGQDINGFSTGAAGSAVYPTANLAFYIPFVVLASTVVKKMWYCHGAATSGNYDIGIYNEDWGRVVSTGSTAVGAATTVPITVDITDTTLARGRYYLAFVCDNTTATFRRLTWASVAYGAASGGAQEASAFPLPATATPALLTTNYTPIVGYTTRTESV